MGFMSPAPSPWEGWSILSRAYENGDPHARAVIEWYQSQVRDMGSAYGVGPATVTVISGTVATFGWSMTQNLPEQYYQQLAEFVRNTQAPRGFQSLPPGVHLAQHQRIGDERKDKYLAHIGEMFSGGFISQEEYQARSDAVIKAQTEEDLKLLTLDLPTLPRVKPEPKKKEKTLVIQLLAYWALFAGGLFLACLPGAGLFAIVFALIGLYGFCMYTRATWKRCKK